MIGLPSEGETETRRTNIVLCVTSMKDLMEKRLASMVDRPWARQLWAMKPAFSSARQIASSPSFQFQLGMFSRWAFITKQTGKVAGQKIQATGSYFIKEYFKTYASLTGRKLAIDEKTDSQHSVCSA